MAETLVHRIQFLENNPYGLYVTGDIVDIYYDPTLDPVPSVGSTDGFSVKLNGSSILSGAQILYTPQLYKIESPQYATVCNNTTAVFSVRANVDFPYVISQIEPGHEACALDPGVCDLIIIGTPVIVSATGESEPDGVVTIVASSSNPIEYRLNTDFIFGDGSAQDDGVFTSLLPGTYRIYIRDSKSCSANVLVTIPFSNIYSPIYTLEYTDYAGQQSKVVILKRDYSGPNIDVCGGDVPYIRSLRGEGTLEKFASVLSTESTLLLTSEFDLQFGTIYTNSPREFRQQFYKNNIIKWVGNVLPQQYQEQYKSAPYYVTVVATDSLASLADYPFYQDDGQRFTGSMRIIELIAYILKKTGIELPIRVMHNLFADGMATGVIDDPLHQSFIDTESYYITSEDPNLLFVLQGLLEPFGARIIQEDGYWNIIRVEELTETISYRIFDVHGVYQSNGSENFVIGVSSDSDFQWANSDQNMELRPGYGKAVIKYRLGLKTNILKNGDFRLKSVYNPTTDTYSYTIDRSGFQLINGSTPVTEGYQRVDGDNFAYVISAAGFNGAEYILSDTYSVRMGINDQIRIKVNLKLPPSKALYVKIRMVVTYGPYYLTSDGSWTTEPNELIFFATDYDKYFDSEIVAESPDSPAADGYDLAIKMYIPYWQHAQFMDFTTLINLDTVDLPEGTRTQVRYAGLGTGDRIYYYELENSEYSGDDAIFSVSDRGGYNASSGNFPSSGGSGGPDTRPFPSSVGSIRRADFWTITTAGTIGGTGYSVGQKLIAKVNGAGNTVNDWLTQANSNFMAQVVPEDYFYPDNTKLWVLKGIINAVSQTTPTVAINSIGVEFLANGATPPDAIVREMPCEPRNNESFEKEVIHGTYSNVISTSALYELDIDSFSRFANNIGGIVSTSILISDLIYTAYIRDVNGIGFENWTRLGDSDSLHGQWLKMFKAQYKSSWKKITGSIYSETENFSFLNIISDLFDSGTLYLPISLEIDDKKNMINGEFLQIINVYETPEIPFSSGFTTGFGSIGFD